jgi:transcriptional regulator with XRE-family HTH domain
MCNLRIRDLREDHDLMQSDIAALLKTTKQQYSKYELMKQEFPIRHLSTLADFYNVSTDYILGKTKDPNPCKDTKKDEEEKAPAKIGLAEALRSLFLERKGREPSQQDLIILKKFAETFVDGMQK